MIKAMKKEFVEYFTKMAKLQAMGIAGWVNELYR